MTRSPVLGLGVLVAVVALGVAGAAHAVQLVGTSFEDGLVYDVDGATGHASNPRSLIVYDSQCTSEGCPLDRPCGIEVLADGSWLLATVEAAAYLPSRLIHQEFGQVGLQSSVALEAQVGEGDLALDPVSGHLYAFGLTDLSIPFLLLRVEAGPSGWAAPTTTVVGELGVDDISGLAFDAVGTLYALDTAADTLLTIDRGDASTLTSVALSQSVGALAGMDFDPQTGTLYVADGGTDARDALFTLDVATGTLTEVGPLGLESGLSGLAVPEPAGSAASMAVIALLASIARRGGSADE